MEYGLARESLCCSQFVWNYYYYYYYRFDKAGYIVCVRFKLQKGEQPIYVENHLY